MPAVCRQGIDLSTGDLTGPPRTAMTGSETVLVNNEKAVRCGDTWNVHNLHTDTQINGSPTVLVNNRPLVRIGDEITGSPDIVAEGSPNVFAGDGSQKQGC